MKNIYVRSVFAAFDYVMDHFYPAGLKEFATKDDTYAVISIQDTHTGGFGFRFEENLFCKGVLTLYFDDIAGPVEGAVLFSEEQARRIIDFILDHTDADTLLVHCFGGQSRSMAVGAFAAMMLGADETPFLSGAKPNEHVLATLLKVWEEDDEREEDL